MRAKVATTAATDVVTGTSLFQLRGEIVPSIRASLPPISDSFQPETRRSALERSTAAHKTKTRTQSLPPSFQTLQPRTTTTRFVSTKPRSALERARCRQRRQNHKNSSPSVCASIPAISPAFSSLSTSVVAPARDRIKPRRFDAQDLPQFTESHPPSRSHLTSSSFDVFSPRPTDFAIAKTPQVHQSPNKQSRCRADARNCSQSRRFDAQDLPTIHRKSPHTEYIPHQYPSCARRRSRVNASPRSAALVLPSLYHTFTVNILFYLFYIVRFFLGQI